MTCDELADCWTERWPRANPRTNATMKYRVKRFGRDFAHRDITGITREEAREWGTRHPGAMRWVKIMFNDAMSDGLLPEGNPFTGLRVPRERRELTIPTLGDVAALELASSERMAGAVTFAAYTGLRIGELRAIRADDFLGSHRLRVERQRYEDEEEGKPKRGGVRESFIPPPARDIEDWALGLDDPKQRIWPLSNQDYVNDWKRTRKRSNIWVRFHDLRHFCATWLLDNGCEPWDIAIQLGHNDGGDLVRKTYGHPDHSKALLRLQERVG